MRDLPESGEFDLVWCLDDAVNYLLGSDELEQALMGMRRNLRPGGLLMFDVNALVAYRTFFAEEVTIERPTHRLLWKGRSDPSAQAGCLAEASFEVLPLEGEETPRIPPEMHRQRHFPEAEVRAALAQAGLECLDVFGHGLDGIPTQPVEPTHTKAIYIARVAG
jgi:SAM-dependent methyltransferase